MMALWTDKTAREATGGTCEGEAWQAMRVEIDSRRVQPGDLFVALKGDRFDGHDFLDAAFAKGAVAALVSKSCAGKNCVVVPDTQKGLEALAHYGRARSLAKIVGVTGSVGKTSTKEMVRLALSAHGAAFATAGNYNNHIGTPLMLANLPPDAPFAVFEMGMNHAGEIAHLTRMVRPHVAIVTRVEAVHLEFFDSVEAIAAAKAEIFEGVPAGGTAIIGGDNAYWELLKIKASRLGIAHIVTCGANAGNSCLLLGYHPSASGCAVEANIGGQELHYTLSAIGQHWATTSLFALACAHAFGLDIKKSAGALAGFREPEGRGRTVPIPVNGGVAALIDDSYNASPASMRAAFAKAVEVWETLGKKGRLLAALGDMLELGAQAPAMHASLADDMRAFTAIYTAGSHMQALHDALPQSQRAAHVKTAYDLLPLLRKDLRDGDVLLLKGSHGSRMYELAQTLPATEKKNAV